MITETFSAQFHTLTPENRLNFIGAVARYFDVFTAGFADDTKNTYIRDYNERIFPVINPGISIDCYDEKVINQILLTIKQANAYNESTILARYRHLLTDPCEEYYNDLAPADNPLWGASYKANVTDDNINEVLLRIPKSLTATQETRAAELLLNPETDDGVRIGLAIMLCNGVRNNEAAGFNFGDFTQLADYPEEFILRMSRTSIRDSNERKAGGKTQNAPRRIPVFETFADFLMKRKEYIVTQIKFPFTNKKGKSFNSVDELPIACRGEDFSTPCSASDLTRAGRAFLRDELKMREQQVAGISYIIEHSEYDATEKDPTTYLFRRNYATHLYTLGFPIEWSEYCMGHVIEDDALKRADFNDEKYLHQMVELLEQHPLNHNYRQHGPKIIKIPAGHYFIAIANRELSDPISITLNCPGGMANLISVKSQQQLPTEIDITKFII